MAYYLAVLPADAEVVMATLLLVTSPPYGSEGPYNALRLADALLVRGEIVELALMGDAVTAALAGQQPRSAHASLEELLSGVLEKGAGVALCGTCCQARGLSAADLVEGARVVTIHDIAALVTAGERCLSF